MKARAPSSKPRGIPEYAIAAGLCACVFCDSLALSACLTHSYEPRPTSRRNPCAVTTGNDTPFVASGVSESHFQQGAFFCKSEDP